MVEHCLIKLYRRNSGKSKAKKYYERTQQTNNSYGELNRKLLQHFVNDKRECDSLITNSTKYVNEFENDSFSEVLAPPTVCFAMLKL